MRLSSPCTGWAGLNPPDYAEVNDELSLGLRRMLGRLGNVAVAVFAADWRMIWWSPGWAALLGDPSSVPPLLRNFAKNTFPVNGSSPQLRQWPVTLLVLAAREEEVVCDLRRATGRYPHSARLVALVEELKYGNERFAELWAAGAVGVHRQDRKIVDHPATGPIAVDCDVLTDAEHEQKIVMLRPSQAVKTKQSSAELCNTPTPMAKSQLRECLRSYEELLPRRSLDVNIERIGAKHAGE